MEPLVRLPLAICAPWGRASLVEAVEVLAFAHPDRQVLPYGLMRFGEAQQLPLDLVEVVVIVDLAVTGPWPSPPDLEWIQEHDAAVFVRGKHGGAPGAASSLEELGYVQQRPGQAFENR